MGFWVPEVPPPADMDPSLWVNDQKYGILQQTQASKGSLTSFCSNKNIYIYTHDANEYNVFSISWQYKQNFFNNHWKK
jgi:hypothetical protein